MKRQVFFSFHYVNDNWRVQQVRNMGVLEGNTPVSSNEWEEVKRKGDDSIKRWINSTMNYRSCVIVLAGRYTADRKWINYEIERAWKEGKGLCVVYINKLKDVMGKQDPKGSNPLEFFCIDKTLNYIVHNKVPADSNEINLSKICKAYDSPCVMSDYTYNYIKENIDSWCEEAIKIRNQYPK